MSWNSYSNNYIFNFIPSFDVCCWCWMFYFVLMNRYMELIYVLQLSTMLSMVFHENCFTSGKTFHVYLNFYVRLNTNTSGLISSKGNFSQKRHVCKLGWRHHKLLLSDIICCSSEFSHNQTCVIDSEKIATMSRVLFLRSFCVTQFLYL